MVDTNPIIHAPLHCNVTPENRGTIAIIGNMDGVHKGHQALIREGINLATARGARVSAILFDPHPRTVFRPDDPPFLLTDIKTRARLLTALGIDQIFVLPFIDDLYHQTPEEFVNTTLSTRLGLSGVITGEDFQFGAGRTGNVAALRQLCESAGIHYHAVIPVEMEDGEKYSSSHVRQALRDGMPERAAQMLDRPWVISGTVQVGRQLARTLDFPTANVPLGEFLRPKFGVYAVTVALPDGVAHGVANIGIRPTIGGTDEMLEVHLFDRDVDLYGQHLDVALHHFLRPEQKFDDLDALKEQIARDGANARAYLSDAKTL